MTGLYASVEHMGDDILILDVRSPEGYGFSDQVSVPAGVAWQQAAEMRLALAGWRVVGEWWHKLDDEEWRADVEPVVS